MRYTEKSRPILKRYLVSVYEGKLSIIYQHHIPQHDIQGNYGQDSLRGESTTTDCGVNYQLLALMLLK